MERENPKLNWIEDRMALFAEKLIFGSDPTELVLQSFDAGDRVLFDVWTFKGDVENGGIPEYLVGTYSFNIDSTITSLRSIGEDGIALKLQEIFSHLPEEYRDLDRDQKVEVIIGLRDSVLDKGGLKELQRSIYAISAENLYEHVLRLNEPS